MFVLCKLSSRSLTHRIEKPFLSESSPNLRPRQKAGIPPAPAGVAFEYSFGSFGYLDRGPSQPQAKLPNINHLLSNFLQKVSWPGCHDHMTRQATNWMQESFNHEP